MDKDRAALPIRQSAGEGVTMAVRQPGQRSRGGCAVLAVLGLLLPGWLAAPASAQKKQPDSGAAAPPASVDLADRKQLLIVGSPTLEAITDAVIKRLTAAYVLPAPVRQFAGVKAGMVAFCAGTGLEYPDIVAAAARMGRGQFDTCVENGVRDIVEVEIGDSALVLVTKKGDPVFNVTPRMVYTALAEKIPIDGEFKANNKKSWNDVDKTVPDLPIKMIVPAKGWATRGFFDDDFMQGGCRHVKEIDAIFAAAERVPQCITLRDDGPVSEVDEGDVVKALMKAPPGTLAVVGWLVYLENKDKLEALPIDGVVPSHENIGDDSYEMSMTMRYYFKRAHMEKNLGGKGVVEGILEFMREVVSDPASGEGGYLEKLGLVALEPQQRLAQQNIVRRLKRFQP